MVGQQWGWSDLGTWTIADWKTLVEQPDQRTWVAYYKGAMASYYELHQANDFSAEIRYFG